MAFSGDPFSWCRPCGWRRYVLHGMSFLPSLNLPQHCKYIMRERRVHSDYRKRRLNMEQSSCSHGDSTQIIKRCHAIGKMLQLVSLLNISFNFSMKLSIFLLCFVLLSRNVMGVEYDTCSLCGHTTTDWLKHIDSDCKNRKLCFMSSWFGLTTGF